MSLYSALKKADPLMMHAHNHFLYGTLELVSCFLHYMAYEEGSA